MKRAPIPQNEAERKAALDNLKVLDTPTESAFDQITALASKLCNTKIALVSLVDSDRQWFKSRFGLKATETPRDISFCGHAIHSDRIFEVPDAALNPDFCDNPLFLNEPHVRFYAGAPLTTSNGFRIGTLCVIDSVAKHLTPLQREALEILAKQVVNILELRVQKDTAQQLLNQLHDAQSIAKIGSWNFDLKTNALYWSSEHYRIFEIDEPQPQEQLFKLYRERIHPDDRVMLDQVVDRALKHGEDFLYNHRVYLDNGKRIKHVQGIGKVTKDEKGKPLFVSGTCQDLTNLIELQEQNKFILKSMGIGIWKYNPVNQSLVWDQSMYELYEMDPAEFSGHYQAWESSLSPETKKRAVAELEAGLSGKAVFDTTFEIKTKSNIRKQIRAKATVIRNDKNEPIAMLGINSDCTTEFLRQKEIEQTKRLLQSIIDASPSTIFVKDSDGKYLICNEVYAKTLGKTANEVIGKTLFDIFPKPVALKMSSNDRQVLESGKPKTFEEQIPHNGKLYWHLVSLFPISNSDGTRIGLGGIITNIQDAKDLRDKYEQEIELERAKSIHNAKLASLGEMSAGIAHEINNPLAIIVGMLPLLDKCKNSPDKFSQRIDKIQKAASRIEKIVKGLRKFARSSEGSVHKIQSLKNLLDEAIVLTEPKAKRHSTQVTYNIEDGIQILCDEVEIEQVLVNLINNAIDAAESQPEKWVKINALSNENGVLIQIIDSGPGVSKDIETKLFQPFFTTKPVGSGTGLGLSISKGILDQHKASITFNRKSRNTCFEIRFPKIESIHRAA